MYRRSKVWRPARDRWSTQPLTCGEFTRATSERRRSPASIRSCGELPLRSVRKLAQSVHGGAQLMRDAAMAVAASPELHEEAVVLRGFADAAARDGRLAAKSARADWHRKTRRRG